MLLRSIKQSKNSQGSALIITILLITAISTVLFSVARLTYSDLAQATRLEESITANYAAESGIELGLLSYRFNHEAETNNPLGSNCTSNNNCAYTETDDSVTPPMVTYHGGSLDLDFTSTSLPLYPSTPTPAPSASMRMWFREDSLGDAQAVGSKRPPFNSPKLLKDQTIELDLSNLYPQTLQFFWTQAKIAASANVPGASCSGDECDYPQVKYPTCETETNCPEGVVDGPYGLEFTLSTVDAVGGETLLCDKYYSPRSGLTIDNTTAYNDNDQYLSWSCFDGHGNTNLKYKLRIKPLIGLKDNRPNDRPYVYYAVQKPGGIPIDNGTTHIVSTGTYGSTRRTLTIDLDRSSTKLLGLYDLILGGLSGEVTGTSTVSPSPSPNPSPTP